MLPDRPERATPLLTANVYCDGALDLLICQSIAPFWSHFETLPEHDSFFWFARYGRGGEHLKIRFHGPPVLRESVREQLDRTIRDFLASLPGDAALLDRDCKASQFPIDAEDECSSAYPDRTLLWTTYRWIPGIMGRNPMSDDPLLASRFTRCLGFGSQITLRDFRPDSDGVIPPALRTSLALKFFVAAFRALRLSLTDRMAYLRYHRDWLLTSFELDVEKLSGQFDERLRRRPEVLVELRKLLVAEEESSEDDGLKDPAHSFEAWRKLAQSLFDYVLARANDPDFVSDPYLRDQVFATPFKLLHALTNQVATGVLNEGYLCQLLLRSCEEGWFEEIPERRFG